MKSQNRLHSFRNAFRGIGILLRHEPNARIHLVISTIVVAAGFYFQIKISEWAILLVAICMVITTEIINTSIENLCDRITAETDPDIRNIKDIAAAAVLLTSIFAVIIGILIFWPYVFYQV